MFRKYFLVFCILTIALSVINAQEKELISVQGTNLSSKMRWLSANVQSDNNYLVEVNANEAVSPVALSFDGVKNSEITLKGVGAKPVILNLKEDGSLITIGTGITLIIDGNIELRGKDENDSPLIMVNPESKLILKNGKICANECSNVRAQSITRYYGGGVHLKGIFIMDGGVIADNILDTRNESYGGGVFIDKSGNFTMNGGTISGNKVSGLRMNGGGGVYNNGIFTMNNGNIINNSSSSIVSAYEVTTEGGGGVYVNNTFIMNNGNISNNTASSGGGVCINNETNAIFTMNNGKITKNNTGVVVHGKFNMNNGEISGNTYMGLLLYSNFVMKDGKIADNGNGGVHIREKGNFTMEGGIISGNTAEKGAGIFIVGSGTEMRDFQYHKVGGVFNKTGGIIYGYKQGDKNSNTVKDKAGKIITNKGHAVFVEHENNMYIRKKDATSGADDKLSFNGMLEKPASTGDWEWDF